MVNISFLLPTNQTQFDIDTVINNINYVAKDFTIEIVICSPDEIFGDNVIWIKDTERSGCVFGFNTAYKASSGEYIYLAVDDHYFDENFWLGIRDIEQNHQAAHKISCLSGDDGKPCRLPDYCPNNIITRFPVFHRSTVNEKLDGFIYHPRFKHHYPDNWLGYYLAREGENTYECQGTKMHAFKHICRKDFDEYDELVFKDLISQYNGKYI